MINLAWLIIIKELVKNSVRELSYLKSLHRDKVLYWCTSKASSLRYILYAYIHLHDFVFDKELEINFTKSIEWEFIIVQAMYTCNSFTIIFHKANAKKSTMVRGNVNI